MFGLPARIALFVVVDVPLLRVFFRVEIEDQVFTWSSIFQHGRRDSQFLKGVLLMPGTVSCIQL